MPANQNQRPKFYEEQYLGAADLTAAVDYGRLQNARHALGAHTWGIAAGLQLKETVLPGGAVDVYVMPGCAWDGFGRLILVLVPYKIPADYFGSYVFTPGTDNGIPAGRLIKVWLRYHESATQPARPGFGVCGAEDQRSRVQETFRLEIGERPGHGDRHSRISVAGNLVDAQDAQQKLDPQTPPVAIFDESIPYQEFPDEGEQTRWLIPLGVVRWKPNVNPNQPGNFVQRIPQDLADSRRMRRYIGVVAESVQAADGVLRLRDRRKDYSPVPSDDLVWVEGSLRIEGDAKLFGSKLDFRRPDGLDLLVPIRCQRAEIPGIGAHALQVVLGPDSQTKNRFVIGRLKADGSIDEKFMVESGGDLTVSGTARKPGGGSWTNSSDVRLKEKIEPLTDALTRLLKLRGVHFEWKEPETMGNLTGPQIGLVAQEVEKIFPEWVSTGPGGYKETTIRGFEALAIEAIRELQSEIRSLKTRLAKMERQPKKTPRRKKQTKGHKKPINLAKKD
ncbi:MAG TPA: tail fiber domain-containing protein [Acidobacteriota bacterium]